MHVDRQDSCRFFAGFAPGGPTGGLARFGLDHKSLDSEFAKLCTVLGAPEIPTTPAYRTNSDRLAHRSELIAKLSDLTRRMTRDDLLSKLEAVGAPAGPINNLEQVFENQQVKHRGMRIERESAAAKGGVIPGLRTPIMMDGVPLAAERRSPRLGEHTQEVLREIGEA